MFTQKALDFLFENMMKDSKLWYDEHRDTYKTLVQKPLMELVTELAPTMLGIDGAFVTDPKKVISRVRRDTRFSKNKQMYRDVQWFGFSRAKELGESGPGYFFEFSPRGFRYGCGFYSASPQMMEGARKLILGGDRDFKKALMCVESHNEFHIEGDMYKRSKCPDASESIKNWANRKSISTIHNSVDFDLLFSDRLASKLAEGFVGIAPVYKFLQKVAEQKND